MRIRKTKTVIVLEKLEKVLADEKLTLQEKIDYTKHWMIYEYRPKKIQLRKCEGEKIWKRTNI